MCALPKAARVRRETVGSLALWETLAQRATLDLKVVAVAAARKTTRVRGTWQAPRALRAASAPSTVPRPAAAAVRRVRQTSRSVSPTAWAAINARACVKRRASPVTVSACCPSSMGPRPAARATRPVQTRPRPVRRTAWAATNACYSVRLRSARAQANALTSTWTSRIAVAATNARNESSRSATRGCRTRRRMLVNKDHHAERDAYGTHRRHHAPRDGACGKTTAPANSHCCRGPTCP